VAGWLLPPLQVNASWARCDSPLRSHSVVLIPNMGFTTEIERCFLRAVRAPWMSDALRLIKADQQIASRDADDSG